MPEILKLILLFIIGSVAGLINVNAGGGSSLTLPALIFMGLEGALANGTNRIGILVQTLSAVSAFKKEKVHQFRMSFKLALFALPGAICGALLSVRLSNDWFQRILGMVMIGIVLSMMVPRPKKNKPSQSVETNKNSWLIYPAMVGIGFYGGFIQVGVGFILMASLYYILKITLVRVNMHKVFIVFIYTIPALAVFILSKRVNWLFGAVLGAGMAFGGWWGVKLAVRGGEKAIRIILAIAMLIMAAKLLKFF
jgi:uncharacterized membrane protein YfcA